MTVLHEREDFIAAVIEAQTLAATNNETYYVFEVRPDNPDDESTIEVISQTMRNEIGNNINWLVAQIVFADSNP